MDHRPLIVIAVIGLHVLGLWALQTGLLHRAVELVVPVSVISDLIEPPQPQDQPTPPAPLPRVAPPPKAAPQVRPVVQPTAQPVAVATPTPEPHAPTGVAEPLPSTTQAAAVAAEPAIPSAPPAKIELPSSSADYLNNPPPPYPPLSKKLGEQGKVIVRAFIDERGTATKAEIRTSSGYDRLDQAALQTVLKWRYAPGKRAGVPEAMWFNVPIHFVLE